MCCCCCWCCCCCCCCILLSIGCRVFSSSPPLPSAVPGKATCKRTQIGTRWRWLLWKFYDNALKCSGQIPRNSTFEPLFYFTGGSIESSSSPEGWRRSPRRRSWPGEDSSVEETFRSSCRLDQNPRLGNSSGLSSSSSLFSTTRLKSFITRVLITHRPKLLFIWRNSSCFLSPRSSPRASNTIQTCLEQRQLLIVYWSTTW